MPSLTFDDNNDFSFGKIGENIGEITNKNTEEGGGVTRSCMNLIFLLDVSGSMGFGGGQRINQLNTAMPIALDAARDAAMQKETDLFVRIIAFNDTASWVMGDAEKGVSIDDACTNWTNLSAGGSTDTAGAIRLALTSLRTKYMGSRNFHPVVILITDGESNVPSDTKAAADELSRALCGNNANKKDKVWRFAIGVEGYNEAELLDFAMTGTMDDEWGNTQEGVPMVFKVDNVTDLAKVLKNVTQSSLLSSATTGTGESGGDSGGPIIEI